MAEEERMEHCTICGRTLAYVVRLRSLAVDTQKR